MALTANRLYTGAKNITATALVSAITATAGNTYIVVAAYKGSGTDTVTISSTSGTWTNLFQSASGLAYFSVWICSDMASGSVNINCNRSNNPGYTTSFAIDELVGATSTPMVQHHEVTGQSTSTTVTMGAYASSSNLAYMVGIAQYDSPTPTVTYPTGSTVISAALAAGSLNFLMGSAISGAAPSTSLVITKTGLGSYTSFTQGIEIAVAGGGGGSVVSTMMLMGVGP